MDKHYDQELKLHTDYFQDVLEETKTFEIRRNDRDFQVGQIVCLREFDNHNMYTGNAVSRIITYVTDYEQAEDFVVFGMVKF